MQTAAIFDIDGTIFRDSLLVAHFKKMIKNEILPEAVKKHLEPLEKAWENREIDYDKYLNAQVDVYAKTIVGLDVADVEFAARKTIETESKKLYKFTREQIKWHKEQGHTIIFISGSPDFLVSKMAEELGADLWFGTSYLIKHDKYTGKIIPMWDSVSKQTTIDRIKSSFDIDLENSYAYGDTNGDFLMLKSVGHPVAVNPNFELISRLQAENLDAEIVLERKNCIWKHKMSAYGGQVTL